MRRWTLFVSCLLLLSFSGEAFSQDDEIKVEKGDMLYIYSDGFADQFGGPKGKKYMSRKFRDYLASISSFTAKEQEEKLQTEFYRWKGNQDQIDDVCVMGVKIQ